jgi:hypothetical protein
MKVEFSDEGVFVSKIGISGALISRRQIGIYDETTGLFMADLRVSMLRSNRVSGSGIMIQSSAAEGSIEKGMENRRCEDGQTHSARQESVQIIS